MPRTHPRLAALAASLIGLSAVVGGCGTASHKVGTTSGNGVTVEAGTAADLAAFPPAFNAYAPIDNCTVEVVPNTAKFATVNATGDEWAIATMEAAPTCQLSSPSNPYGSLASTSKFANFPPTYHPIVIFERPSGGTWRENDEGTNPFPCPSINGAAPGLGVPAVPQDVLTAWGLQYAGQACATARQPSFPRD